LRDPKNDYSHIYVEEIAAWKEIFTFSTFSERKEAGLFRQDNIGVYGYPI